MEEAPGVADAATTLPTGAVDLYGPTVMTDGPQAYWRLGEASGTTAVDVTTDYAGSYHGSASLGEDGLLVSEAVTAVEFDGSSSYVTSGVDSPLSFASTGKKSFEAWIAPTGDNPTETVVFRGSSGHGYDYWVWWEDDEIWVNLWTSGGSDRIVTSSGADTVPDDETSHIVVTLDDATDKVEFYVNGVLVRTVTTSWFSSSSSQGTDPLVIGRRNDDSSAYFDGVIDEVALYSKVLSQRANGPEPLPRGGVAHTTTARRRGSIPGRRAENSTRLPLRRGWSASSPSHSPVSRFKHLLK